MTQKIEHTLTEDAFNNPIVGRRVRVILSDHAVEFELVNGGGEQLASVHLEIDPEGYPVLRLWDARYGVNDDPRVVEIVEDGDPRE